MSDRDERGPGGDRRGARAVEWLSVPALWRRTRGQLLTHFARRDPRQAFAAADASVPSLPREDRGDVWVDYVADVGDGYQATRAVAWCQSRPQADTVPGDLLVFGGDEVYPVASPAEYARRLRVPYDDLLAERRLVLAVPGNHDWYDLLAAFPEVFTPGGRASLPMAGQRGSYWSYAVPGGTWWIWGLDFGLRGRLDDAQRAHFERQRDLLAARPGPVGLVVCTAEPFWQKGEVDMGRAVDELLPANATSVLHLSGDKHHFAVWQDDAAATQRRERVYVTAGGGGAYLAFTDDVPAEVPLDPPVGRGDPGAAPMLPLRDVYPEPRSWRARDLARALVPHGPGLEQLGLLPLTGAVYGVLGGLVVGAVARRVPDGVAVADWATRGSWLEAWWRLATAAAHSGWCRAAGVALLAAGIGLTIERRKGSRLRRVGLGSVHALAHAAAVLAATTVALEVAAVVHGALGSVLLVAVLVLVGAAVGNALVVGYLVVAARRGINLNAAAAAVASPHRKNFVRLRFAADGWLEVAPFTIARTDAHPGGTHPTAHPTGAAGSVGGPACVARRRYRLVPGRATSGPASARTSAGRPPPRGQA